MKHFVDTNIFLRFFIKDEPKQALRVQKLFEKAKNGNINLWTHEWVISEIVWTLFSYYGMSKGETFDVIKKIINTQGLEVRNKNLMLEALDLYLAKNVDLEDAISAIIARDSKIKDVFSYDKHFDRISWLKRSEP